MRTILTWRFTPLVAGLVGFAMSWLVASLGQAATRLA